MEHFNFKIKLDLMQKMFREHLSDTSNKRILFSGAFGVGKTYFLQEYFKENEKFIPIHLYPVNYQVNRNEDIFELLKYDILLEFISLDWVKNDLEINKGLAIQSYLISKGFSTSVSILENLPKIGKSLKSFHQIIKFIEGFSTYNKELKKGDFDIVKEFSLFMENKKGSVQEFDIITNLIQNALDQNRGDKEVVLILDDLDRIDPEHLFRILNIFSAHFDSVSDYENKFGFDRIVLVCDANNVKSIFNSKYGVKTDFNGYVDKFYSSSIFKFDNQIEVGAFLKRLFDFYIAKNERLIKPFKETLFYCVMPIIRLFVRTNVLNLRDLKRMHERKFNFNQSYRAGIWGKDSIRNVEFLGFLIVEYLLFIFGNNVNKLLTALDNSRELLGSRKVDKGFITEIIHLSNIDFLRRIEGDFNVRFDEIGLQAGYKVVEENNFDLGIVYEVVDLKIKSLDQVPVEQEVTENEFMFLIRKAVENYFLIEKSEFL